MSLRTVSGLCALTLALLAASSVAFAQTDTSAPPPAPASPQSPPQPPPSQANEPHRIRIQVGPQIGTYIPTSAKTRDRFGDAWLIVGVGLGSTSEVHPDHHFTLDLQAVSTSRSGAQAIVAPIGLSYAVSFGSGSRTFAGVSADAVIAYLRSDKDHLPSRTRFTGGGGLFVGERFSEHGYIEARYNAFAPVRGFDLSGVNLTLGLRF